MPSKRSHDWRKIQSVSRQPSPPTPNLKAKAAIFEAIDNQLRDLTPPETKQTFDRLLAEGHSSTEAKRLLACALAAEFFAMMKAKQPYDQARYIESLHRLPKLPGD